MNSFLLALVITAMALSNAAAFSGSFTGNQITNGVSNSGSITMEYIPNGMSKEQWKKLKAAEKNKNKGKNLGATGITSFKSRSFSDWQKSGGKNLFPVDPTKVKSQKEIPYMQRAGGSADDSDIGNKKKGGAFGGMFGKKKATKPAAKAPEPEKKTNWWTL